MVLVSSPDRVIQSVNCRFDGGIETGRYLLARHPSGFVGVSRDQAKDKTPKARALVTACVRLFTPSLP
jgi:hypothetical protein